VAGADGSRAGDHRLVVSSPRRSIGPYFVAPPILRAPRRGLTRWAMQAGSGANDGGPPTHWGGRRGGKDFSPRRGPI